MKVPTRASCAREIQLRFNVQTNVVGFVAVELLSSGSSLVGFRRNESDIIVGNFLARPATWRGGNPSVNALAGQQVQLHIMFAAARVFSFQFVCKTDDQDLEQTVYDPRPVFHVTPPIGWMNDPNGLCFTRNKITEKVTFHLFYQAQPNTL